MTITSDIDDCFLAPTSNIEHLGTVRPVLFLLRRDLVKLYGSEKRKQIRKHKAPMLAVLGMMAGIDLITKFSVGQLEATRTQFKKFLIDYGKIDIQNAEAFYQFRCALAHSYGLLSFEKNKKGKIKTIYRFVLCDNPNNERLIEAVAPNYYMISFWQMKKFFLSCINEMKNRLDNPNYPNRAELINNIENVTTDIGYVGVR
jgi:hypothetical protein